jgi:hypothetical protein
MDIMNYAQDFGYRTGHQGLLSTLTFPLAGMIALSSDSQETSFAFQKQTELQPIFVWLIPLIVLTAGLTLSLDFMTGLGFYTLESLLLAALCKGYLQLEWWQVLELALNFGASFLLWSLILVVFFALLSIFLL